MSDNIFAEIYNKILGFFGQNVKDESKNTAVNRLRLVLMQDRTNLTPEIMNRMRAELIAVLSKYVELDKEALDLNIGQEGEQMALMLSIPVIRAKDEAEIEEAIKKEEEAKEASKDNSEEEEEDNNKEMEEKTENQEESSDEISQSDEAENEDKSEEIVKETTETDENAQPEDEKPTSNTKEKNIDETTKKSILKIEKHKKEETSEE